MPKHTQTSNGQTTRRLLRTFVKWSFRFLRWTIVATLVTVIIAALVALLAYHNRVQIVNQALATLIEPFDVSVASISFKKLGLVEVEDLNLSPKDSASDREMASISNLAITYDLKELRATQRLKSVQLSGLALEFDQAHLNALSPSSEKEPEKASGNFDLSTLARFTDTIEVEEATLSLDIDALPPVIAKWNFKTNAISFDEQGLTQSPLSIELSELVIGEKDFPSRINSIKTAGRVGRDLERFVIDSLIIEKPHLNLRPEWVFRDNPTREPEQTSEQRSRESSDAPSTSLHIEIADFQLIDGSFAASGFDGRNRTPGFPDISFLSNLEVKGLQYSHGLFRNETPLRILLKSVEMGLPESQLMFADEVALEIDSVDQFVRERTADFLSIKGISVVLSDETLAGFQPAQSVSPAPRTGEKPADAPPWRILNATLDDGTFLMNNWSPGGKALPGIESRVSARLQDLQFGSDGFESAAQQTITLENSKLRAPGTETNEEPLIEINLAELAGSWNEFDRNSLISRLTIRGPSITFTDETLGEWLEPNASETATPGPVNRPVYKVEDLEVTGGKIVADSQFAQGTVPKLFGNFRISTAGEANSEFLYHLVFEDVKLSNHARSYEFVGPPRPPTLFPEAAPQETLTPVAEEEVFTVRRIELDATAEELQRTRRIDRIKVSGGLLKVGNGLRELSGNSPETGPDPDAEINPPRPPDMAPLPSWSIGEIEITRSQIQFEALIPQVEGLQFALETKLTDVPLSLEGLLSQEAKQKIELSGIEIKDPYNSFITVAFLPTIFVEFSLAGLANQEIDKIDLIGPSLYVGQGLFWWVDYQRNFRAQNEGASVGFDGGGTIAKKPDWQVKEINATAGKIIVAPTGIPVALVPFPFDATTYMSGGNIELNLTIPGQDYVYSFPDYKVDLHGLEGKVQFNVPVQNEDNNLVQTFELDKAVFRDYEAENLYLTVTFDSNGVYGKFGGDAYSGYAEGEFNFYLNDPGKWDAWVAGTGLDTGPLTEVIAPDNFKMDGLVTIKLVSEGRNKVPGKSSGEITMESPGWFHITKLDQIIEGLPAGWKPLQRSLTELGLTALKRFDYDQGAGSLSLHKQEGDLQLRFAGPYGTRELNLFLHDDRNTTNGKTDGTNSRPSASARAVD